jgi:hypothetical protein
MWKNLVLLLSSLVLSIVLADFALGWLMREPAYWKAREFGQPYDGRDRLDVILANRATDPNWFPAVPANTYLEHNLMLGHERIIPLGGVASAQVVGCNEAGFFSTFATDEAGFNNPSGTWPLTRPAHVFLVGDSFTQGDCVRGGAGIADQLRQRRPEVVNLGVGGNGPLMELAGIREYVQAGRVSYVFWLYFEGNDLHDLQRDSREPILLRYLDAAFGQNLLGRQVAVNQAVRQFVEHRTQDRIEGRSIVLRHLREAIWRVRSGQSVIARTATPKDKADSLPPLPVPEFLRAVARGDADVKLRGGQLVFVYLPEYFRLLGQPLSHPARQKDAVLRGVRSLGVPTIDMEHALRRHPSAEGLFPLGLKAHYNDVGYRLIAEELDRFVSNSPTLPK